MRIPRQDTGFKQDKLSRMEMEIHNGCSTKKFGLQETKQIHHVMYILIKKRGITQQYSQVKQKTCGFVGNKIWGFGQQNMAVQKKPNMGILPTNMDCEQ